MSAGENSFQSKSKFKLKNMRGDYESENSLPGQSIVAAAATLNENNNTTYQSIFQKTLQFNLKTESNENENEESLSKKTSTSELGSLPIWSEEVHPDVENQLQLELSHSL